MLRSSKLHLYSPNNLPRHGEGFQFVRDGFQPDWEGHGTFKQSEFGQTTRDMGAATARMAVARSRAIPQDLPIVQNSWRLGGPDGIVYEIVNVTRTGNLTTLRLEQAVQQSGHRG